MILQTRHYNKIGHEINESLTEYPSNDREVYCKKLHTVKEPEEADCMGCPYFGGLMQGYGHECVWDDDVPTTFDTEQVVDWEDRNKEFLRVSKLIDKGVLKKG